MSGSQPPNGRVFASTPMCPLTAFSSSLGGIRSPQLLLGLLLGIACVTRVAEASREEEHNHGDLQTVELRVASMLHAEPVAKINLLEIAENSTASFASARMKVDCNPSDCTGDCDGTTCLTTNCQWDVGAETCTQKVIGAQSLNMYEAARKALKASMTTEPTDQQIVDKEHEIRKDAEWAKIEQKLRADNSAITDDEVEHEKIKHDLMYSDPSRKQWADNLNGKYIHVNQQYNLLTKTANDLVDHIDNGAINVAKTVAAAVAAKTHAEKLEGEMAQYGEDLRYLQKGGTHFAANVKEYHKNVQEQLKHKVAGADLKNLNGELEEWYASGHSRTSPVDPFALDERTSPSKKIIAAYVPPAYDPRHMAHDERSGDTISPKTPLALSPSVPATKVALEPTTPTRLASEEHSIVKPACRDLKPPCRSDGSCKVDSVSGQCVPAASSSEVDSESDERLVEPEAESRGLSYTFPDDNYSGHESGLQEHARDTDSEGEAVPSDLEQIANIIKEKKAMSDKALANTQLTAALKFYVLKMKAKDGDKESDKEKITAVLKAGGVEIL